MDKLWAPWRSKYILTKSKKSCIFCDALRSKNPDKNFVVSESKFSFSMLNLYPYNNGHLLVAPKRHINDIDKLKENETADLFSLLIETKKSLDRIFKKPHGYNIGLNIGASAGAGFAGHIHIHIVPRWKSDTNFMSAVSDTRVISQSLITLHKKLKKDASSKE